MTGNAGPVAIQGCAIRISRLNADGSVPAASATGMIVDDKPFLKFTAKPAIEAGVEMVPKSACGTPLIAYKDYDRIKRWDVTLDLGDSDFEKQELIGGGSLLTAATSAGRTFADGATTTNSTTLTSPALGAFTAADVGRSVTGTGIPVGTYVAAYVSATQVTLTQAATATATGLSIVLGALAARTIGYQWPQLLTVGNPNGVAIEIWQKAIVRGTGFQGTTPYPSAGSVSAPALNPSAWIRFGAFRCIWTPADITIEDNPSTRMFTGWAIENPLFGTGPSHDWTTTGAAGGTPVDTTKCFNAMMDFALPTPLQPGYQTTAA